MDKSTKIAVVIPAFKVAKHIRRVVDEIGPEVSFIYVVDDACPEESGKILLKNCLDPRVRILFHTRNQCVGAAVMT